MAGELADLLTDEAVARLAGARSYERGEEYASNGAVSRVAVTAGRLEATVHGTSPYRVRIDAGDGRLQYACTCPVGRDGHFCKHCVAVALRWLDGGPARMAASDHDVRSYLESLPAEELVDLLVEQVRVDEGLARRLTLRMLGPQSGGVDVAGYRAMLDDAIEVGGYVPYAEAWGYFEGISEVVGALDELLANGHPDAVIDLAEHAFSRLEAAIERIDDSDGGTSEIVARLEDLYLAACEEARPDPVALAERLFAMELNSDYDFFSDALGRYTEVLGAAGVARYRELAEAEWAARPSGPIGYGRTWRVARIMEAVARRDGDIDAVVKLKSADLDSGWRYLEIAQTLEDAGRDDEALEWAERGLLALPDHVDRRLREYIVVAYQARGRHQEAVELLAPQFAATPTLADYQALHAAAEALGEWPQRRAAAHRLLADTPSRWRDRSALVAIALWENDISAAWEHAHAGGCSRDLWRELARARSPDRPEDAIAVYRKLVGQTIGVTNDNAYRQAVELIEELEVLLADHDRQDDIAALLAEIRTVHRRKRNLMKRLDQRWPATIG